jgi:hypothetical protein
VKLLIRDDISPCSVRVPDLGVGIPLVPGGMLDTDAVGITDPATFAKTYAWAFEGEIEDMSAEPGRKRSTKRLP